MSTKVPQNSSDQEIDIFQLSRSINRFFDRANRSVFRAIQFFIRNWIIVLILVVLGAGLGYYLDSNKKSYNNQIVVTPNFESVDYLYAKVDLIQSKIAAGDVDFLKNTVGISNPQAIRRIEIKPIADVQEANVYADIVQPIFENKCYTCHNKRKKKGGLRLDEPSFEM